MVPIAHFSHAVRSGDVVQIGATAGTDSQRCLAGTVLGQVDFAAQAQRMFDNLETALQLLDSSLQNVVRLKTYVADPRDIQSYQRILNQRAAGVEFSHSIVGSWGFPLPQAAVELDAVAVAGAARRWTSAFGLGSHNSVLSPDGAFYCTAEPDMHDVGARVDPTLQSAAALTKLLSMVRAANLDGKDICNLHITLADARDFAAFETIFVQYLEPPYPSRTVVVAPLNRASTRIQIEAIAVRGGGTPIQDRTVPFASETASPATLVGDTLYVSGQTGLAPGTVGDVEAQTRAAWDRIERLTSAAGFSNGAVLRTNNVLTDWRAYGSFNSGYSAHVLRPYPPRTTVLGGLLQPEALVQIEAIVDRNGDNATVLQAVGAE